MGCEHEATHNGALNSITVVPISRCLTFGTSRFAANTRVAVNLLVLMRPNFQLDGFSTSLIYAPLYSIGQLYLIIKGILLLLTHVRVLSTSGTSLPVGVSDKSQTQAGLSKMSLLGLRPIALSLMIICRMS